MRSFTIGDADGLQAEILAYGGILKSLRLGSRSLVLELDPPDYRDDRAYVGVIVGRVANRISRATFALDGARYALTANEGGNQLHGGMVGFGKRYWNVLSHDARALHLEYLSPDGEEGYPGNLRVHAQMRIADTTLLLELTATSDAACPVSLTYHPYFNISGDPRNSLADHLLRIPASRYLPVDAALLPTGDLAPVLDTAFDFRRPRPPAPPSAMPLPAQLQIAGGFDHCWVLDQDAECAAELHCETNGITLHLLADTPGLQFYGGQGLRQEHPHLGHGICLEPQELPNAVNLPQFGSVVLPPGRQYHRRFAYRFSGL